MHDQYEEKKFEDPLYRSSKTITHQGMLEILPNFFVTFIERVSQTRLFGYRTYALLLNLEALWFEFIWFKLRRETTVVYISFCEEDEPFSDNLGRKLRDRGCSISGAGAYDRFLSFDMHIRACDVFLVIISPESVASPQVGDEILLALRFRKPIVPIFRRNADLPIYLNNIQYIDFRTLEDDPFEKLYVAVQAEYRKPTPCTRPEIVML